MGGFIPLWFSDNTTKIICIVMAVMNFISKSKKKICNDTTFCNFSIMLLDNCTIKIVQFPFAGKQTG